MSKYDESAEKLLARGDWAHAAQDIASKKYGSPVTAWNRSKLVDFVDKGGADNPIQHKIADDPKAFVEAWNQHGGDRSFFIAAAAKTWANLYDQVDEALIKHATLAAIKEEDIVAAKHKGDEEALKKYEKLGINVKDPNSERALGQALHAQHVKAEFGFKDMQKLQKALGDVKSLTQGKILEFTVSDPHKRQKIMEFDSVEFWDRVGTQDFF